MASVYHLYHDGSGLKQSIVDKYNECSAHDKKIYYSAVAIQKIWRGYYTRKKLREWHQKALIIQRNVRGWLVRIRMPDILRDYYMELCVNEYHRKATKIQAFWRGYRVRKTYGSVKSRLKERREIEQLSSDMQLFIRKAFEDNSKLLTAIPNITKVLSMLFDRHHLLRTTVKEGVFSIHGSDELSYIEKILKSFPLKEYMDQFNADSRKTITKSINTNRKRFLLSPRLEG